MCQRIPLCRSSRLICSWFHCYKPSLNPRSSPTKFVPLLDQLKKEKDLGLTISADMKVSEQCGIATAKGNKILGLITRNIVYKEKDIIIPLCKTIVMPHLEYCIQAWRPYRKKDIDVLEIVQRRAAKMMPKLRNISYEMRIK